MLQVTKADVTRCGGFLSALADRSVDYVWQNHRHNIKWQPAPVPERLVVHKAPHLDDYFGEFLFRAALPPNQRLAEFLEMAVYAKDDSTATMLWPRAAVFGIGQGLPCAAAAAFLFDEHIHTGGRTADSCAHVVANQCFSSLSPSVVRVLEEVGQIDRAGGAHPLHLNNLLKTVHQVNFSFGITDDGRDKGGKLTDDWKRAVVSAIVAAAVYCLDHSISLTNQDSVKSALDDIFQAFEASPPFVMTEAHRSKLNRIRGIAFNVAGILKNARLNIGGSDEPQLLVFPFLAVAAEKTWGKQITAFLMTHFLESELQKDLNFESVDALIKECLADPKRPKPKHTSHCSISAQVVHDRQFFGKRQVQNGNTIDAKHPSRLWIIGCRHTNAIIQPHKALIRYLQTDNWGIGLVFLENTKECTKTLFRGQQVPDDYWNRLVERIQSIEPGVWYQPVTSAPFLLNGNAAHQYVRLSKLTPTHLARLCKTVPQ